MKRLLITGANGQLGTELVRQAHDQFEVLATDSKTLNITDNLAVLRVISEFSPDFVINAAAYTAVDKAESDSDRAYAVNVEGPRYLAQACAIQNARLVHISTDFVFDGTSSVPYKPNDAINPLSVYGKTKAEGEQAVVCELGDRASIVRTSWVYGPDGNNFVKTMLRLMTQRPELGVVVDQVGAPTSTNGLASAVLKMLSLGSELSGGIYQWTDAGVASWYDFATAIGALARRIRPDQEWAEVKPIYTENYPTPAVRPAYSVMDCRELQAAVGTPDHWASALEFNFSSLLR